MSSAGDAVLALPLWAELLVAALLVVGAGFALVGSWALAKWRDPLRRLHGPSKATTLGVGCVLIASAGAFAVLGQPSPVSYTHLDVYKRQPAAVKIGVGCTFIRCSSFS